VDESTRSNGKVAIVVTKTSLHGIDDDVLFWLGKPPEERVAAVEVLRQRVFGGDGETGQGLQRVCRIIHT
jgi:hypothetical protein